VSAIAGPRAQKSMRIAVKDFTAESCAGWPPFQD
jgi:hypothetical protein